LEKEENESLIAVLKGRNKGKGFTKRLTRKKRGGCVVALDTKTKVKNKKGLSQNRERVRKSVTNRKREIKKRPNPSARGNNLGVDHGGKANGFEKRILN